jgi:uncharacterized membrane protein YqaE (UPF0057 family)
MKKVLLVLLCLVLPFLAVLIEDGLSIKVGLVTPSWVPDPG